MGDMSVSQRDSSYTDLSQEEIVSSWPWLDQHLEVVSLTRSGVESVVDGGSIHCILN